MSPGAVEVLSRPMADEDPADGPVDAFLRRACLSYSGPDRSDEAEAMLAADPGLAVASVHTLAACGRAEALAAALARDPSAVAAEGGPHRWVPLLSLCYSRVAQQDAAGTLAVLLGAGADPDAGFLWRGMPSPFTALTGVLGGGERGDPPHPDGVGLAGMLLDAGADPNDNQALYNRAFGADDGHLPPLLAHGLGQERPSPWRERLGTAYPSPAEMLGEHLRFAASSGFAARVRLLLAHGVDPDAAGYHPIHADRTSYEVAVRHGHTGTARVLADAGARTDGPDAVDRLVAAAMTGDRESVAAAPEEVRRRVASHRPDAVRIAAVHHGPAALAALVELGADLDAPAPDARTALHEAALAGDTVTCRWLLAHGADPTVRDATYDAPPAGWAAHAGHAALADELRPDR